MSKRHLAIEEWGRHDELERHAVLARHGHLFSRFSHPSPASDAGTRASILLQYHYHLPPFAVYIGSGHIASEPPELARFQAR